MIDNIYISIPGAVLLLGAYIGVQERWLRPHSLLTALLNFFGATLLALSAIAPMNVGILIVESFWALASLRQAVQHVRQRRKVGSAK